VLRGRKMNDVEYTRKKSVKKKSNKQCVRNASVKLRKNACAVNSKRTVWHVRLRYLINLIVSLNYESLTLV
jgi:hypothetical protein